MGQAMTRKGSSLPPTRPASPWRAPLLVLAIVVGVPVWLVIVAAIALLAVIRPLAPLAGLATAFCFLAAIVALVRDIGIAPGGLALAGVFFGLVFFGLTAFGDRLGLGGSGRYPAPPWTWFI